MARPEDIERDELIAAVDTLTAQREAALDVVEVLVRMVTKQGGYTTAPQQAALRGARALLAEAGR